MITSLITLLIVAVFLLIVWYVVGLFITQPKIMSLIGIVLGLILLLYALRLFHISI